VTDEELAQQNPEPEPPPSSAGEESEAAIGTIHYSVKQAGRAREVLTRLHALRKAVKFYPLDHPSVEENVMLLGSALRTYHDEGVEVQFAFFEGEILLGDKLLTEESVVFSQVIEDMVEMGVGSLVFRRGVDDGELGRAATVLAADPQEIEAAGGIVKMAEAAQIPHVAIGTVQAAEYTSGLEGDEDERAYMAFASAVELIEEIDETLKAERSVNPAKVRGVVRSLVDSVLSNRYSMLQLTGLKNFDEYTFYHSANVAILSIALGSLITHDERFLSALGTGALMHDVGKLSIQRYILNKPGQLTAEEWEEMRLHPVIGAQMMALMPGLDKSAVVTILEHHMRWDGAGYPTQPEGHKQHLASRIVAVADSYDAMTSRRSYSAARVQDEAMSLLVQSAGSSLDPSLVKLFVGMLGLYPPRTVVRLTSGEIAIVLRPTDGEPERPTVRIISSATGLLIDPVDIVLAEHRDIMIQECLDPRQINVDVDDYI
jgi:HD-GYP domain-containing protein (c-di-GMP phosphodiesterase class II)